jgi:hypothetical protein
MSLTTEQLQTLKASILAETDPTFVEYRNNGDNGQMAAWYNQPSTFVVRRSTVMSSEIGPVLNYLAVGSLTTANRDRATTFLALNPVSFTPTADIEAYWDTTFGGALGGEGANTRAALQNLWRRFATRCERLYVTGTGTTVSPGVLVFEGNISSADITDARNLP